jgi:uncharacterized secreted protein with C-terminal beta-propeller domain
MFLKHPRLFISLVSLAALQLGCASDKDSTIKDGSTIFESDPPQGSNSGRGAMAADSAAGNSATPSTSDDGSESAERAIEEADIVKFEGNRLYALSQYGGLNVIDTSNPDHLRLLGRKKVQASPFEMYVKNSIVFALYNGYGEYVRGAADGEWNYAVTSYVIAFDTTNPEKTEIIGKFAVPGTISDSRIVGNVLYVVGFEQNNCWGCQQGQHTTVISLDVSDPSAIRKVDQLSYADDTSASYSWQRSISVNDQRMYIAGPEYGSSGPIGSTIQVVDISDPKGDLVEGTTVKASGVVSSRWQMDEYSGNLRVITQPGSWSLTEPVRIQTFKVASAREVTPLANVAMDIPLRESLRSVRFDGLRGYAITAEQKDPLFTIDLSDPAAPKQAGQIEIPGWIYHMEPRGNRVVALGYDQGNPSGALAISLFDVSTLAEPKLLDRVNFGGDWAWINEAQDQVHKAFQVLDDANLVLMPFTGWDYSSDSCYGKSKNGIQLIDWGGDDLTLRGVAPLVGQARRGLFHNERLYAMSDERVETFDIADRSAPKPKGSVRLAHNVQSTVAVGDTIVKFSQDWYSNVVSLDTTTLANVENPEPLGHIDLAIGTNKCGWSSLGTVAKGDGRVYLVINEYRYDESKGSEQTSRLVTVDVSSPTSPKVIGNVDLDFGEGWSYWSPGSLVNAGERSVVVGNALVMLSSSTAYDAEYNYVGTDSKLRVLDVSKPNEPKVETITVKGRDGTTGLFASGGQVALGRYAPSPTHPERVRFYVDRFDVTDPAAPKALPSANVPGSLIAFDASASNVATADYKDVVLDAKNSSECYEKYSGAWWQCGDNDCSTGGCHTMQHSLNLVKLDDDTASLIGSKSLEKGWTIANLTTGDDRVFMTLRQGYGYYAVDGVGVMDCINCSGIWWHSFTESKVPLVVLGGLSSDDFAVGSLELTGGDSWGYSPMAASKDRVLLSTGWQGKLVVVDAKNAKSPALVREAAVSGTAAQLTITKGMGIASLYYDGVQTIAIED